MICAGEIPGAVYDVEGKPPDVKGTSNMKSKMQNAFEGFETLGRENWDLPCQQPEKRCQTA
jgi:hypothetical protein